MNIQKLLWLLCMVSALLLSGCSVKEAMESLSADSQGEGNMTGTVVAALEGVPEFNGKSFVVINENKPEFEESDYTTESFESYSELDSLGRCGTAVANIGKDLMPVKDRESISPVKPSGWQNAKYDCVEGKYLYNRCHLIGYQLSGENANKKNLVTGTRYMNVEGMLPFENEVADYVKETDNHVLYRVTPVYEGNNLVASGVQMEAWSVEDGGKGVCFNVYAYNNQPGVEIDYATGKSCLAGDEAPEERPEESSRKASGQDAGETGQYICNTNTRKFHTRDCSSAKDTKGKNRKETKETREQLIGQGYEPCGRCHP
ncbi:MAG: DNA/RNA non-specific endonuclease [Eubacterium sp.]|nr:DNA/RNA non-specific endonuclease [Eubacterium sp.]